MIRSRRSIRRAFLPSGRSILGFPGTWPATRHAHRPRRQGAEGPSAAPVVQGQRLPGLAAGARGSLSGRRAGRRAGLDPHRHVCVSRRAQPLRRSHGRGRRGNRFPEVEHPARAWRTAAVDGSRLLPGAAASARVPRGIRHPSGEAPRLFPRLEELADKTIWGTDWPSPGIKSMRTNVDAFMALPLGERPKRKILYGRRFREICGMTDDLLLAGAPNFRSSTPAPTW